MFCVLFFLLLPCLCRVFCLSISILFLLFPYCLATSSFHHHASLCLHGSSDNPYVTCAVSIITFFILVPVFICIKVYLGTGNAISRFSRNIGGFMPHLKKIYGQSQIRRHRVILLVTWHKTRHKNVVTFK